MWSHTATHMACNYPKNLTPQTPTIQTNKTMPMENAKPVDQNPPAVVCMAMTKAWKLMHTQQIAQLEEEMSDEEQSAYLDACDMGMDFYDVEP